MTVEQFLTRFSQWRLPAQLPYPSPDMERNEEPPAGFEIRCADPKMRARIQRAAESWDASFEEFVADAVMGAVRCSEENMILSPKTGRVIGDEFDLRKFEKIESDC